MTAEQGHKSITGWGSGDFPEFGVGVPKTAQSSPKYTISSELIFFRRA